MSTDQHRPAASSSSGTLETQSTLALAFIQQPIPCIFSYNFILRELKTLQGCSKPELIVKNVCAPAFLQIFHKMAPYPKPTNSPSTVETWTWASSRERDLQKNTNMIESKHLWNDTYPALLFQILYLGLSWRKTHTFTSGLTQMPLDDAFGLVVSTQNERLHCLAVRGGGAAVTNTGLEFNIHTLQDNPTAHYLLHDGVSLFHFMFKHGLSSSAVLITQAWLYGFIQNETASEVPRRICHMTVAITLPRFGVRTLLSM